MDEIDERGVVSVRAERWGFLSVIDELWSNTSCKSLDLSAAGAALIDELCLGELCRALAHSPTLQIRYRWPFFSAAAPSQRSA